MADLVAPRSTRSLTVPFSNVSHRNVVVSSGTRGLQRGTSLFFYVHCICVPPIGGPSSLGVGLEGRLRPFVGVVLFFVVSSLLRGRAITRTGTAPVRKFMPEIVER